MGEEYLLREEHGELLFSPSKSLSVPDGPKHLSHDLKIKILKNLNKKSMYPSELAVKLGIHEQNLYYHINHMLKSGILEVAQRKEIRGTVAKKLKPTSMNFSISLSKDWQPLAKLTKQRKKTKIESFYKNFELQGRFNGKIVVGSPDPHGPFKARARDGHYATDLSKYSSPILHK